MVLSFEHLYNNTLIFPENNHVSIEIRMMIDLGGDMVNSHSFAKCFPN